MHLRFEFKEKVTAVYKPCKPVTAAKIHATLLGDARPLKVEVEILDKVILHALKDGSSGINIMPFSTFEKLGLEMTGLSPYDVNMPYQHQIMPLGQVASSEVIIGKEVYTFTFHVFRLVIDTNNYPIL